MYSCKCCNFETKLRNNYNRHLTTKRHLEKSNNVPINTNNVPINTNNNHTCNYCNSNYTKLSSLNRHQKNCIKKILEEKELQLQEKDSQIKLLKHTNDKLLATLNETQEENIKLNKAIHKVKDRQLNVLQKNLKPSNNNNSQIIINNYPNAPNLGFPENIPVNESLNKYIQLGGVKGLGKFISDHWAKDINPVDRSIWMVDSARNKFLIRYKDAWVIDIDGTQFQELNIKRIQKIFDDYLQTFDTSTDNFDEYQHIKTMEFIIDIKTKNMIVKGLKDAGKYLVYDQEKFPNDESVPETVPELNSESIPETIQEID